MDTAFLNENIYILKILFAENEKTIENSVVRDMGYYKLGNCVGKNYQLVNYQLFDDLEPAGIDNIAIPIA